MWYYLTSIIGRVHETLLAIKFHVLCFVIASKSNIIGGNIERIAVTSIPLDSWTAVTDASFNVGWQARHTRMNTTISHTHRIVLSVRHTYWHLAIPLVLLMHLVLQMKVVF